MKKEDFQNSQQETGSAENKGVNRDEQRNKTTRISNDEQENISRGAGLGRDRMTDIKDLGGLSGSDDLSGGDDDLTNEKLNAANDQ
jgi:hypothetical protein